MFFIIKIILILITKKQKKSLYTFFSNLAYKYIKKRTKIAWANLDFIYGDSLSSDEKEKIIKRCYLNYIYVLFFFIQYKGMGFEKFLENITFTNEDVIEKAIQENKKIIIVSYHYGVWEFTIGLSKPLGDKRILITAKFFKQKVLQDIVNTTRTQYGMKTISHVSSMKKMLKHLKSDEPISIFVDQRTKKEHGIEIDFLGKKTYINYTTAMLAKNQDAILIPVSVSTNDFYSFNIDIGNAIIPDKNKNKQEDILRMSILQTKYLEDKIKKDPGLWLWIHKKWIQEYPEIYKEITKQ